VKFVKADGDNNLVFQLGRREKALLLELLKLYPVIPSAHYRISGTPSPEPDPNQQLLEESLAEHRNENARELDAMLHEPGRFQDTPAGYRLVLSPSSVEWLLQVLNDIRVGSWLHLGSPDEKKGKHLHLTLDNARYLWAMEMSGVFQSVLLAAREA
jgi:hypothetical protein